MLSFPQALYWRYSCLRACPTFGRPMAASTFKQLCAMLRRSTSMIPMRKPDNSLIYSWKETSPSTRRESIVNIVLNPRGLHVDTNTRIPGTYCIQYTPSTLSNCSFSITFILTLRDEVMDMTTRVFARAIVVYYLEKTTNAHVGHIRSSTGL